MSQFQSDVNTAASLLADLQTAAEGVADSTLTDAVVALNDTMSSGFVDPTTIDQAKAGDIRDALLAVESAASEYEGPATTASALHAHLEYMLTAYRTDIDPTFSGGKPR